jgi:uncharacterized membrane protein
MDDQQPGSLRRIAGDPSGRVLGVALVTALAAATVCGHVVGPVVPWLRTNLLLAAIAPAAATFLFAARRRGVGWWLGAAAAVVMLPNTPYVLTDIVHFGDDQRAAAVHGLRAFDVPLTYVAVIAVGVLGYAYVLARLIADVRARHGTPATRIVVGAVNGVCAAGVWLGRVPRLNSWDVARPHELTDALADAMTWRAVGDMAIVFVGAGAAALAVWWLVTNATERFARTPWPSVGHR